MDSRVRELIKISDAQFGRRGNLLNYWQSVAENFYPERADFTIKRYLGNGLETGLMTSMPVLARRELGNMLPTFLRPDTTPWFALAVSDDRANRQHDNRAWLEWASGVQYRAMYDPAANFVRASSECDHDWVSFGNGVMSLEVNMENVSLLYRTWHLRDCAWAEGVTGKTECLYRKWKPTIRQLNQKFPKTIDPKLLRRLKDEPEAEINCLHIACPREDYDIRQPGKKSPKAKWMSFYIDIENETVLEESLLNWFPYITPRWSTVSGSQYGWSPATGPGLADARTLQAITRVLLEAGEKAIDPPMVATQDAVRSDINIMPGGVTWVDIEYDERLGEALRPLTQNLNLPEGLELADRLAKICSDAMFLNKINLPTEEKGMTAYEVRKRIEEAVRSTAPLFRPAEKDYNAPLCELSFEVLASLNAFGPAHTMPTGLQSKEIRFGFTSPLTDMMDEGDYQKFMQAGPALQLAASVDPAQTARIKMDTAFAAALRGSGFKEAWLEDDDAVAAAREAKARQAMAQQGMAALAGGAAAAKDGATAASTLQQGGLLG